MKVTRNGTFQCHNILLSEVCSRGHELIEVDLCPLTYLPPSSSDPLTTMKLLILALLPLLASSLTTPFKAELKKTAEQLIRPGYGLLACDESTGTVGAR